MFEICRHFLPLCRRYSNSSVPENQLNQMNTISVVFWQYMLLVSHRKTTNRPS